MSLNMTFLIYLMLRDAKINGPLRMVIQKLFFFFFAPLRLIGALRLARGFKQKVLHYSVSWLIRAIQIAHGFKKSACSLLGFHFFLYKIPQIDGGFFSTLKKLLKYFVEIR